MSGKAISDCLTVVAIAVIAYATMMVTHEIIGHCGMAALVSNGCSYMSTTDIRMASELSGWTFRIVALAGNVANWLVALICLVLLRRARRKLSPAWQYFLWLTLCVNLFVPFTYMLTSPIIAYGDWYLIPSGGWYPTPAEFTPQVVWRSAFVLAGAVACWLSFRLCLKELRALVGSGGHYDWRLIVPAYLAGSIVTVAAGLFSPLPAKWAQLQAAGATFGFTSWLLLMPLLITETPTPTEHPFVIQRSARWIVAGALVALVFVGVLGRGFPV